MGADLTANLRADLLAGLTLFGGVRATRELLYTLVRREEMKSSVIYQDIFQEGRVEGRVEDILRILRRRFGELPEAARAKVSATAEMDALDRLLDLAVSASSLEEFVAQA